MGFIGGLLGGSVSVLSMAALAEPATANLSLFTRAVALGGLLALALLFGTLTGSAIGRRSRTSAGGVVLFSGLAGAVCGGFLGGALFAGVTGAYMRDFGTWPGDTIEMALSVLAVPVLGALGMCVGALAGFALGGLSGMFLTVLVPRRR